MGRERVGGLSRRARGLSSACAVAAGVLLGASSPSHSAASETAGASRARSPRNASYDIEVRLDPEARSLEGAQTVVWRNLQSEPTSELWFHLYWNAWRNERSTWMVEDELRKRSSLEREEIQPEDWGYVVVDSVEPAAALRFAAPDDGNPEDRTVLVVSLTDPVPPGGSIELRMNWHARVPRTFARTGRRGDFYFFAHWFPKLGVYEPDGWNCHQYHAATEYYSDYGVYDVAVTLPARFVVGASGSPLGRSENFDGTVTHRYRGEDIHDFAWTASPDYEEHLDRFEAEGLPGVDIRLLLQPEHRGQAQRHLQATRATLEIYGRWFGAYPYPHLTVVDPAYGSGAGGMEYPTLFTAGTRLFNPAGGGSPEHVTIHEAGHQFWYGLVGNNEFEHAWLDEGINTYLTGRAYQEAFGDTLRKVRFFEPPGTDQDGFFPLLFRNLPESWSLPASRLDRYRKSARSDVPATPTWRYHPGSAGDISYSKTALWWITLERYLGWPAVREILATLFERRSYGHPEPEELFEIADQVSGQDLSWFFDQVHRSQAVFDYAVESATSRRARSRGLYEAESGLAYRGEPGELFRSEVVVRRQADGVFPVQVLLVFEDGSEVRRSWDGASAWKLFVEEGPSRLDHAVVDPERVLMLDLDYTNNSYRLKDRAALPAVKWASVWLVWLQDLLSAFAWFS